MNVQTKKQLEKQPTIKHEIRARRSIISTINTATI